jgi:starch synthase
MSKLRILYVSSEISPFLETSKVAEYVRQLPESMQEKGMEIRILVPKFGCINERKSRLHEVVRLSGININMLEEDKPLIIKVASIPTAKLQVYFIDNDDYFGRKSALFDKENNFHADNDERAIFFCKGVLETVKKLGWAPDIIHCSDWMTSLIPMYLRTHYKKEPIFKNSKTVFTVFDNHFSHKFDKSIVAKAKTIETTEDLLLPLKDGEYQGFIKLGMQYADSILKASETYSKEHDAIFAEITSDKPLEYAPTENNMEFYFNFYNELAGVDELVEG